MPLQNRVLPTGEIIADPARGTITGNRGILHDNNRVLKRRYSHPHWIACRLIWKDVRRVPMTPNRWTELFFLDECVALAAGHRPCAYCRNADYRRWCRAWETAFGGAAIAAEMDRTLHASRLDPATRQQRCHMAAADSLPPGSFILLPEGRAALLWQGNALPYDPGGYGAARPVPQGNVTVLTPAVTVAVLRAGYAAMPHFSAFP